jgi:hypothetical protein
MIRTIRPWQIFERLQENEIRLLIPTRRSSETRSVMMLETALLVAVARKARVQTILEIGTSHGYTTLHLARNTDARITTVDVVEPGVRVYRGEPEESRITELCQDSKTISIRNYEMVFIDGDHSIEGVREDTKLVFQCSPLVIAWHDYGNPIEPEVKPYLDKVSEAYELYHVEDSWLCFWFREGL